MLPLRHVAPELSINLGKIKDDKILGNTNNRTWGCWMRSASVLYAAPGPTPPPHRVVIMKTDEAGSEQLPGSKFVPMRVVRFVQKKNIIFQIKLTVLVNKNWPQTWPNGATLPPVSSSTPHIKTDCRPQLISMNMNNTYFLEFVIEPQETQKDPGLDILVGQEDQVVDNFVEGFDVAIQHLPGGGLDDMLDLQIPQLKQPQCFNQLV